MSKMNEREIKQRRDQIDRAWRRDEVESEPLPGGTGMTQELAKQRAADTQNEWNERAAPTPNKDRLATPRKLEAWERSTDDHVQRGDSRSDSRDDAIPSHILAQCPPGRRPVKRADGGYAFEMINGGTRADSTRVTRRQG